MAAEACELCGLPLRYGNHTAVYAERTLHFCCAGCKMVYSMLMEAADAPTPDKFRETDLYRRCVQAGVVPASEEDLRKLNAKPSESEAKETPRATDAFQLEQHFRVEGMWCPACAWVIQDALEKKSGVIAARCDFATDRLHCRYDPVKTSPEQMAAAVNQLGYEVLDRHDSAAARAQRSSLIKLIVSGILSANVMMLSWALYSGFFTQLSARSIAAIGWPAAVMATIVLVYAGRAVFRKAWYGVLSGAPGMEALIVLGAGSAYFHSLVNLIQGSLHLYFDTASMLICLLLLGKLLESRAKNKVREDLDGFLALEPRKVRLCTPVYPGGRFTAIENLRVGDRFRVEADEVVPADGRVGRGRATVNAAAITGEPKPVVVGPGDPIVSGCRLLEGALVIEALKTGRQTMLGQMIAIVQQSLSRKTALESRTDRLLAVFVPLLAGLAALTAAVGFGLGLALDQAIVRAVTVLVIACPCALGIAIPLARVAGIAGAGKRGLLVRDFAVFERLPAMDTVVFDKTGTMTHGNWRLETVEPLDGRSAADILAVVCRLEEESDHAVARAVREYGRGRAIQPADVTHVGSEPEGVRGMFQGQPVRVGSLAFVMGEAAAKASRNEAGDQGAAELLSNVYVGSAGRLWAVLKFGDTLREGMQPLIARLKDDFGQIHLISGDSREATGKVGARLGIAAWQGGLLPQDKADYIKRLQNAGRLVLMVGDGINDAPALAQADLAVAVHSGAPLTQEAAQVTLMRGTPAQLVELGLWSRSVDRKVRQNLWCAFAYNLVSIPMAMTGLLTPLVAVTAMLLSSMTVIGNTLLLVRRNTLEEKGAPVEA